MAGAGGGDGGPGEGGPWVAPSRSFAAIDCIFGEIGGSL